MSDVSRALRVPRPGGDRLFYGKFFWGEMQVVVDLHWLQMQLVGEGEAGQAPSPRGGSVCSSGSRWTAV